VIYPLNFNREDFFMQEKIRVIRIHPGEGVLVLASEPEPPVPPCPMAMAVPEAQESDALLDFLAYCLRVA
jgi:hypothetical protein